MIGLPPSPASVHRSSPVPHYSSSRSLPDHAHSQEMDYGDFCNDAYVKWHLHDSELDTVLAYMKDQGTVEIYKDKARGDWWIKALFDGDSDEEHEEEESDDE